MEWRLCFVNCRFVTLQVSEGHEHHNEGQEHLGDINDKFNSFWPGIVVGLVVAITSDQYEDLFAYEEGNDSALDIREDLRKSILESLAHAYKKRNGHDEQNHVMPKAQ